MPSSSTAPDVALVTPQAPTFAQRLRLRTETADTLLCIGLDPTIDALPAGIERSPAGVAEFCRGLIAATTEMAAAFKPNLGFFIGLGREGLDVLWDVRQAIPADVPVILDCKVGDIGSTAAGYAQGWFGEFAFDAITVNPFLGEDSVAPFLSDATKGVFLLCKTSNPGSGDVQDLPVGPDGEPLFLHLADTFRTWSERHPATIGMVVGATWPEHLAAVRSRCPDQPILLPGLGAQGGDVAASVQSGTDMYGHSLLCSASRSIMYASSGHDFAEAARVAATTLRDEINAHRPQRETSSIHSQSRTTG
ncbi:MAG: orotidine-5'-phosphate decarboxylase [Thermomicrobiales bacterium]